MTMKLEKQNFNFKVIMAECETDGLLGLNSW